MENPQCNKDEGTFVLSSYKTGKKRIVEHEVLWPDGTTYVYQTKIPLLLWLFFDKEVCYDYEHIVQCGKWG